jgi:uncharacterized membrane protein YczE/cytidylate kinase
LILRKNFKLEHVLQIPVSIAFGYFIDLSMKLLFFINPRNYAVQIIYLILGCLVLGIGVYMEVLANVVMLPGESFVRAVVLTWQTEFGTSKIVFDVSMTVIAGALSFVFFGKLQGVREGTIVAALLVGFIARTIGRMLSFLPEKIYGVSNEVDKNSSDVDSSLVNVENKDKICIVIGREYGSGGHDYGKHLAEKLGYDFYDNEIMDMTAKKLGYETGYVSKREEAMTNSLLYDLVNQMYAYSAEDDTPKDSIYETEKKIIQELAETGKCVIVGRCADYILKNNPRCVRLFLHSPMENRIKNIVATENVSEDKAKEIIRLKDKQRSDNYRYYTRQIWGLSSNYDMSLDTSMGEVFLDNVVEMLVAKKRSQQ